MNRNQVVLDGRVIEISELRYTPGGVPTLSLRLHHQSVQLETGAKRKVECRITAQAAGEVARELAKLQAGATIAVQGFLAKKGIRSDYPVLHINRFKVIEEVDHGI